MALMRVINGIELLPVEWSGLAEPIAMRPISNQAIQIQIPLPIGLQNRPDVPDLFVRVTVLH